MTLIRRKRAPKVETGVLGAQDLAPGELARWEARLADNDLRPFEPAEHHDRHIVHLEWQVLEELPEQREAIRFDPDKILPVGALSGVIAAIKQRTGTALSGTEATVLALRLPCLSAHDGTIFTRDDLRYYASGKRLSELNSAWRTLAGKIEAAGGLAVLLAPYRPKAYRTRTQRK